MSLNVRWTLKDHKHRRYFQIKTDSDTLPQFQQKISVNTKLVTCKLNLFYKETFRNIFHYKTISHER